MNRVLWLLVCGLAFACGGAVGDIEDTSDGEDTSDEAIELGSVEQPITVEVATGFGNFVMGAPKNEFPVSGHNALRACAAGGTVAPADKCLGNTLTIPFSLSFIIKAGTQEVADRVNEACTSLVPGGVICSATVGSCTGAQVCASNAFTGSGLPGLDLRNYQDVKCTSVIDTHTAAFGGNNYSVQRCGRYDVKLDMTAMKAKGATSAEDMRLIRTVVQNVMLQTVAVGGAAAVSTTGNMWVWPGIPAGVPTTYSSGQQCRTANLVTVLGTGLNFTQAHNCANN